MSKSTMFFCGDIGGTYSRLKLYMNTDKKLENYEVLYSKKYINNDYDQFDEILLNFIQDTNLESFDCISLACAGPIIDNKVHFSNINWIIDKEHIEKTYSIKVFLMNDFEACGYGIQLLKENETITLNKGNKQENNIKCCIGAGTGLGQCFIINDLCYPSEGGHCDFSPENELEYELQQFISKKTKRNVVIENIVSGMGIVNIYNFLSYKYPKYLDNDLQKRLNQTNIKAKVISSSKNILCLKTMEIFFKHYGKEVRNSCLKWLPYGGCYISGGLTPRFIDKLQNPDQIFMKTLFQDYMKNIIDTIPIYGVLTDELGERGAYIKAFQETL